MFTEKDVTRTIFKAGEFLLTHGSGMPDFQRILLDQAIENIIEGKHISMADYVQKGILGERSLYYTGGENIPQTGPLLVVASHLKHSHHELPLEGLLEIFAASYFIELMRQGGGTALRENRELCYTQPHWLQAEGVRPLPFLEKIPGVSYVDKKRVALSSRINKSTIASLENIPVVRDGTSKTSGLKTVKRLARGEVVGMTIEGSTGKALHAIDDDANTFLSALPESSLLKINPKIVPLGVWVDGERNVRVKAGRTLEICGTAFGLKAMLAVAAQVPENRRGPYGYVHPPLEHDIFTRIPLQKEP